MFVHVRMLSNTFKRVRTRSNAFIHVQTCLNAFKRVQTCLSRFKLVQTYLNTFKCIWTCPDRRMRRPNGHIIPISQDISFEKNSLFKVCLFWPSFCCLIHFFWFSQSAKISPLKFSFLFRGCLFWLSVCCLIHLKHLNRRG